MNFVESVRKAGKSIVDSGAKTMLKTDVVFLEREVKARKQRFGVEVYDLMEALEADSELSVDEKEGRIRMAFDRARKDIAVIQAKIDCKNDEMKAIDAESAAMTTSSGAPPAPTAPAAGDATPTPAGTNHIIETGHPSDTKPQVDSL